MARRKRGRAGGACVAAPRCRAPAVRGGLLVCAVALAAGVGTPVTAQGLGPSPDGQSPPHVAAAVPSVEQIAAAMQLGALADVVAREIARVPDPLSPLPEGIPDAGWARIAARIATPGRIALGLRRGIASALAARGDAPAASLSAALAFWTSDLGRRAMALQLSARAALAEPAAEAAARAAFAEATARADPRAAQITRLVAAAHLVDPAVALSLNASLAMLRGLRDGGGMARPPTDEALTAGLAAQEPMLRAELAGWIEALLYLSCAGLNDAEVEVLIAATATPGAHDLAALVGRGAEAALTDVAGALGLASAARASRANP